MMFKGGPVKLAPKTFQKPKSGPITPPMKNPVATNMGPSSLNADRKRVAMQKMVQMDSKIKS